MSTVRCKEPMKELYAALLAMQMAKHITMIFVASDFVYEGCTSGIHQLQWGH